MRRTDCAAYGPRTTQEISSEAFRGVTNETRPAPPPSSQPSPPPSPSPPFAFDGSLNSCRARFYPDPSTPNAWLFDCAGADDNEIATKRASGKCASTPPARSRHVCSDGGYDATPILWTGNYLSTDQASTVFACDYGTSTRDCNPRTQDATTDTHCLRNGNNPSGSCHDSCWVDTAGNVYHTDEQFDANTVANGGTVVVDTRCHDGGPNSVSNRCGYGTQVRLHN